jgi:dicarboxylate/amino acid:cation (Na+ or H+) symporter, DAACS family
MKQSRPQHQKIFWGLLIGTALGLVVNLLYPGSADVKWIAQNVAGPIGQIFLRMVFMIIVPLIFTALVLGVADLGDLKKIGRIGFKTLAFTIVVSAVSIIIGLVLVNLLQPGGGISDADRAQLLSTLSGNQDVTKIVQNAAESKTFIQTILDIIPRNPLQEMVFAVDPTYRGGGILAVMFFALIFGIALSVVQSERTAVLMNFLQGLYDVVMKIIDFAMKLAPIGVAALMFSATSQLGLTIIVTLGQYVLVVLLALAIHQFVTYGLLVYYGAKRSPIQFFRDIRTVMLTAFSTSSSNVTLPTSLRVTKEKLNVDPDISNFVLTVGSTANQNGTALYEGVTVLFLAQFYGIDLSMGQQVVVVLLSLIAGIGTAGVPRWIAAARRARASNDQSAGRGHRHHPRCRSHTRHVPHCRECDW